MQAVDPIMGVIVPYLNFALFGILAYRFMRKPLKESTRSQREKFVESAAKARVKLDDAKALADEWQQRLQQLDKEVSEMRQRVLHQAEVDAQGIVKQAEHQADLIRVEAQRAASAEILRTTDMIKNQLVMKVAAEVTKRLGGLTDPQHEAISLRKSGLLAAMEV